MVSAENCLSFLCNDINVEEIMFSGIFRNYSYEAAKKKETGYRHNSFSLIILRFLETLKTLIILCLRNITIENKYIFTHGKIIVWWFKISIISFSRKNDLFPFSRAVAIWALWNYRCPRLRRMKINDTLSFSYWLCWPMVGIYLCSYSHA